MKERKKKIYIYIYIYRERGRQRHLPLDSPACLGHFCNMKPFKDVQFPFCVSQERVLQTAIMLRN